MSSTDPGVAKNVIVVPEDLSVGTRHLAFRAVEQDKIGLGAVGEEQLADEAVTGDKHADGSISVPKLDAELYSLTIGCPDRPPVRVVTTTNISLSGGAPDTYDDITLQMEDRMLVTGQTDVKQNGIYRVSVLGTGANGTWVRADDADDAGDLFGGILVHVQQGTVGAGTKYRLSHDGFVDIGVDDQDWVEDAGGVTDHADLDAPSLVWTASGHTGTANRLAAFDGAGAAAYVELTALFAQTLALAAIAIGGLLIGGTTEKYEVLLDATPATEATVVSEWDDITSTGISPGTTAGVTNGASAVSIAGSPGASTKRLIKEASVYNRSHFPIVVTVRFYDGTNNRKIGDWRINPDEVLVYSRKIGWHSASKQSSIKRAGVGLFDVCNYSAILHSFSAVLASSTRTHVSGDTVAVYLGEAEADFTEVNLQWGIPGGGAGATVTWAEIAIAYGDADLASNPTLFLLGYARIDSNVTTAGSYHTSIRAAGHAGMKLWALSGTAASTPFQQVGSSADNLASGVCATATIQPSAIPAAGTSFTVDGANAIPRYLWETV